MAAHRAGQWAAIAMVGVGVVVIANWPVATRYGVNWSWSAKRIPLYEKAINFLSRDLQTRRLAREVAGQAATDEERLLRLFHWVNEQVRPVPSGFPIVDDHVWNILVRGYGAPDQRAEAFAVLASYAGFPATAVCVQQPAIKGGTCLTVVQHQGRRLVFDVHFGVVFRNEQGALASIEDLLRNPALITAAAEGKVPPALPYAPHFTELAKADLRFFRMENQKPWGRFKSELLRLVRMAR